MWKTDETDIIIMALLYRKKYTGTDILSYDSIVRFSEAINKNLDSFNNVDRIKIKNDNCSLLYYILTDENGEKIVVINPNIDIKSVWEYHVGCWTPEITLAAECDNAMKEIGLIFVDGNIIDRNVYYDNLRVKYKLPYEFHVKIFDIFRDWEKITDDSFSFKVCLSDIERYIWEELNDNKRKNEENIKNQLNVLRRIKK